MKTQSALLTILSFFTGVIAGPALWGAVSSLFWSTAADTDDAQRIAGLLYTRTQLDPGREAFDRHVTLYQCGNDSARLKRPGDIVLLGALAAYRRGLLRSKYDTLAVRSLKSLPAPLLGALNGCSDGSPASSLCLSYVHNVAENATTVPSTTERAWLADVDGEIESALCVADPR